MPALGDSIRYTEHMPDGAGGYINVGTAMGVVIGIDTTPTTQIIQVELRESTTMPSMIGVRVTVELPRDDQKEGTT